MENMIELDYQNFLNNCSLIMGYLNEKYNKIEEINHFQSIIITHNQQLKNQINIVLNSIINDKIQTNLDKMIEDYLKLYDKPHNFTNLNFKKSFRKRIEKKQKTLGLTEKQIKNSKQVYVQSLCKRIRKKKLIRNINCNNINNNNADCDVLNNNLIQNNSKISKKKNFKRNSKFRGVSKNGKQWQVLIMVNKKKRYLGSYSSELEAAKIYDLVSLQNHGKKAKTNFFYSKLEIKQILNNPNLLIEDLDNGNIIIK